MQLIPANTNFDFLGKRYIAIVFSILLTAGCIWLWIAGGDEKYGTDFRGGHEFIVQVTGGANTEQVRSSLKKNPELEDAAVQAFGGGDQFSVRLRGTGDPAEVPVLKEKVLDALRASFSSGSEILRTDFVGPVVGEELRRKALMATIFGILGLLVYISFRFEFAFALGAVIAVFHDVIVATGVYLAAGFQINMTTVAAALTILGYSVNDTIVIFDRVREELVRGTAQDLTLAELMNKALNATLSRTIITTLLTLFSVLALFFFGGGAIADLSVFLLGGLVCGTYSTIFIAAPVVLAWDHWHKLRRGQAS